MLRVFANCKEMIAEVRSMGELGFFSLWVINTSK